MAVKAHKDQQGFSFLVILFVITLLVGIFIVGQLFMGMNNSTKEKSGSVQDGFGAEPKTETINQAGTP